MITWAYIKVLKIPLILDTQDGWLLNDDGIIHPTTVHKPAKHDDQLYQLLNQQRCCLWTLPMLETEKGLWKRYITEFKRDVEFDNQSILK